MLKMTQELAKTFQYKNVCVIDAATGEVFDIYDGEKPGELFMLGNDWADHSIYCITPRCKIVDGRPVVSLALWIDLNGG